MSRRAERAVVGKRRMAREMAVQMLYQIDLGEASPRETRAAFDVVDYLRERADADAEEAEEGDGPVAAPSLDEARRAFEQACAMVESTRAEGGAIDERIRSQAEHWRLERMPPVDRNILRLAVWELLHDPEVPRLVVVDEAVELAKRFGSEQSARFVNGLLDGLMRQLPAETGAER